MNSDTVTLRDEIEKKLLLEESKDFFPIVENNLLPCPRNLGKTCKKVKTTKINLGSEYMLGFYCDDQYCKVSDSNVLCNNDTVIILSEKDFQKEK